MATYDYIEMDDTSIASGKFADEKSITQADAKLVMQERMEMSMT